MKKSTAPTTKKPVTKPANKPTSKPTTKPSTKPATKPAQKVTGQKQKEVGNNKPCDKKEKKEEKQNVDKRAFISKESPKMEKIEIKPKLNMKCIKTVQAHDDWVEKALILASGKVITIALDGIIKIWDFSKESKDTKKPLTMLGGHTSGITDVIEFSKNKIITVSKDKTIRKWNVETGDELFCYKMDVPLTCIKKVDDNLIAVGGTDKSIYILDFSNDLVKEEELDKVLISRMEEHKDIITALEIATNKRLISSSADKTICVWDLNNYKLIKKLEGHTEGVQCLKVLKDGNLSSGSFDNTIKIWDLNKYTCIKTLKGHTGHIFCLNQLLDGKLISGASDWSLIAWDIDKGEPVFTLEGHEECINSIDIFPDGNIITASTDQTVKIWE
jgi:WD40 repeat protein